MKIFRYSDFLSEGLSDLQDFLRKSGEIEEFNPENLLRSEIRDIEQMGGVLLNDRTAQLESGETIVKSSSGYSLEKNGTQQIFVRISQFKTIPSDWEVFRNQVDEYLQRQS